MDVLPADGRHVAVALDLLQSSFCISIYVWVHPLLWQVHHCQAGPLYSPAFELAVCPSLPYDFSILPQSAVPLEGNGADATATPYSIGAVIKPGSYRSPLLPFNFYRYDPVSYPVSLRLNGRGMVCAILVSCSQSLRFCPVCASE